MKSKNHAEGKVFFFVERFSPKGNNLGCRMKKDVKKRTVLTEVFTELLWNSEDNVTVFAFKEFGRNIVRTVSFLQLRKCCKNESGNERARVLCDGKKDTYKW